MASFSPLSSSSRVIAHERVLRCVYEFLDENGYQQSLRALQAESKIPYNVIHVAQDSGDNTRNDGSGGTAAHSAASQANLPGSKKMSGKEFARPSEHGLEAAVMEGSWAEVLHVYVDGLLLPEEVKATLYEVILEEMVELHGLVPAARSLLLNAPIFQLMKVDTPARYIRLEKMIEQGQRTMAEGTAGTRRVTAEMRQRRTALLQQLKTAIRFSTDAPVGRLAAALARAAAPGGAARNGVSASTSEATQPSRKRDRPSELPGDTAWADTFLQYPLAAPKEVRRRFPYHGQQAACCCAPLLLEEKLLLVGRADGVVDVANTENGEVTGNSLRHTEGVLSLARDTAEGADAGVEWVAVGYRDGWVKVYNLETRKLVRRFERAHTAGVTTLFFTGPRTVEGLSRHQSLLVSGSFDGAVRVLDIAAGAPVCTVANCHASAFVHSLLPLTNVDRSGNARFCFVSSGNDGTVALWRLEDGRTTDEHDVGVVAVHRVQDPVPLGQLHSELRDAVPTQLYGLGALSSSFSAANDAPHETGVLLKERVIATHDVLLLTRAGHAAVCRMSVNDEGSHYFSPTLQVLCIIVTARPLRSAFPHVHSVVSLPVPLLSLYAADSEGTVSLHNIEMKWCNAEQWADFGGCMKVKEAADQSSVVIVEVGKAVKDLHVTCVWPTSQHQPSSVIAYGPSLSAVYDIW
ncbi:hypothetical protein ABB37_09797 [Leptomonas pyrrhocoris]|uniref:LisH domain-containing protein n=1 Tax=Leptomonas pyrrhocoris TaxID=157538 RepID=A0A0M9FPR5_LEPPY|nr:hypothetical protein ABB37_09797 [Leptomonas pyrrhocoris]KPA73473.1 hypothetical protein ABB37_09797 [Leptomonas pyrrhocoris]|eukprot:XP_015651912.1 hypothetical protein ABB37_09797 [Leptomonas pyrrhocoris]